MTETVFTIDSVVYYVPIQIDLFLTVTDNPYINSVEYQKDFFFLNKP